MEGGGDTAMCCVGAGCVTGQPSRSAAFETSINNQRTSGAADGEGAGIPATRSGAMQREGYRYKRAS